MKLITFVGFCLAGALCSCGPKPTLRSAGVPPLTIDNISGINGSYEHGLWERLAKNPRQQTDTSYSVKLRAIDSRTLKLELIRNDKLVDSVTLRGRITKHGYFSTRQKLTIIPFFPVYFYYYRRNADLILTNSNDLQVTIALTEGAVVLILSGGGPQSEDYFYKRIE